MRYRDFTTTANDRFRLPSGYPVLAEITIDAIDWHRFQQLVGDTPVTRIVGREAQEEGYLTMRVACASDEVRRRLEDGWG